MTRQHFQALADVAGEVLTELAARESASGQVALVDVERTLTRELDTMLAATNPNFDAERFARAVESAYRKDVPPCRAWIAR